MGNLTSQFWSNCYRHPFDLFVKCELACKAYLRYVDDFALFSNSKHELWRCKLAIMERLAALRLTIHERSAQVLPSASGIPWLGFVIYPNYRQVKRARSTTPPAALGNVMTLIARGRCRLPNLMPVCRVGSITFALRIRGVYAGICWRHSY